VRLLPAKYLVASTNVRRKMRRHNRETEPRACDGASLMRTCCQIVIAPKVAKARKKFLTQLAG